MPGSKPYDLSEKLLIDISKYVRTENRELIRGLWIIKTVYYPFEDIVIYFNVRG